MGRIPATFSIALFAHRSVNCVSMLIFHYQVLREAVLFAICETTISSGDEWYRCLSHCTRSPFYWRFRIACSPRRHGNRADSDLCRCKEEYLHGCPSRPNHRYALANLKKLSLY